ATGALKQITSTPSNEFNPSWRAPNELVYVSDRRDRPGIYAEGDRLLAEDHGALSPPEVTRDGHVAYVSIEGTRSRLIVDGRNIADEDEDVFPFRPRWVANDILYTADGTIK